MSLGGYDVSGNDDPHLATLKLTKRLLNYCGRAANSYETS